MPLSFCRLGPKRIFLAPFSRTKVQRIHIRKQTCFTNSTKYPDKIIHLLGIYKLLLLWKRIRILRYPLKILSLEKACFLKKRVSPIFFQECCRDINRLKDHLSGRCIEKYILDLCNDDLFTVNPPNIIIFASRFTTVRWNNLGAGTGSLTAIFSHSL